MAEGGRPGAVGVQAQPGRAAIPSRRSQQRAALPLRGDGPLSEPVTLM